MRLSALHAAAIAVLLLVSSATTNAGAADEPRPVHISVDAGRELGPLRPIWRFFGADEPNYAYMKDGRKLLAELGQLDPQSVYFRAHNLLTSGDGTPAFKWGSTGAYREDAGGNPIYDWTILDRIFDAYLERGVKPFVQIGFMPEPLSIKPQPYQHKWNGKGPLFTGWSYPPRDYDRWAELVYQWTRHCVEKYGRAEVERWYWEVWNEPNIAYWHGTPEEFYKLNDYALAAVRRALPTARVGGPHSAGGGTPFLRKYLEHCLRGTNAATGNRGSPLDFIAFHAKGSPAFVEGHVRMGIAPQLRDIDRGFDIVASFPEYKNTPVIIGESDPDTCAACQGPKFGYRVGTMYSSYTAASFARKLDLADKHSVNLEGAVTWAFEFENQPLFAGFRVLATGGIDLPVLNTFRMFAKMKGRRLSVQSDAAVPLETILKSGVRDQPDVSALASRDENNLYVLVWHYHDDDLPGPDADIELTLRDLPPAAGLARVQHFRIDRDHSNAYTAWQAMGSPAEPTPDQYAALEKAGSLAELPPETVRINSGTATMRIELPRQAVSLLIFNCDAAQ